MKTASAGPVGPVEEIQRQNPPLPKGERKKRRYHQTVEEEKPEVQNNPFKKCRTVAEGSSSTFPITSLAVSSECIAIGHGTQVEFVNADTLETESSYKRLKDSIRAIAFRRDGKLVATGDDSGAVQVIEVSTRKALRRFKGHKGAVNGCCFSMDNKFLCSVGDDASVRIWELASSEACVSIENAHSDSIRSLAVNPSEDAKYQWATGGLDGQIKLWNLRPEITERCVGSLDHGSPIQSVVFISNLMLASAGGLTVKLWDLAGPPHVVETLSCHLKTITDLAICMDESYLITCSSDATVKIHCLRNFETIHTFSFSAPVTRVVELPRKNGFVFGLSSGKWVARRRKDRKPLVDNTVASELFLTGTAQSSHRYFSRGGDARPSRQDDVRVFPLFRKKPTRLDRLLRSFQYQDALYLAITTMGVSDVMTLLEELIQRNGLRIAVRGRDDNSILPYIEFLSSRLAADPQVSPLLIEFLTVLFEENLWIAESANEELLRSVRKLEQTIVYELNQLASLRELLGMVNFIIASKTSSA